MALSGLTLTALCAFASCVTADFGMAAQLFQLNGSPSVANAKLAWELVEGATEYQVEVAAGSIYRGATFEPVGTTTANTYDVYDLKEDNTNYFRIAAMNGNTRLSQSYTQPLLPYSGATTKASYLRYDNTQPSTLRLKSHLEANGVYYRYNYERAENGSFSRLVEQTSSNGYDFQGDKTVLTGSVVCASVDYSCKLERVQFQKNPTTGNIVMWAHFERASDYGLGQVAVAHGPPGGQLEFDGTFRPLGDDSRDVTFFADEKNAFLVTSANMNSNTNVYSLNRDWTAVAERLAQVNAGKSREAPGVFKNGAHYFIATSAASGWLPSQAQYIVATSMSGPWSDPVNFANTATFCSQSGSVYKLTSDQHVMLSDQWRGGWPTQGGKTRELMLPFSINDDFVSTHFYQSVFYSDDVAEYGLGVYGFQSGRILSVGKPSSSDAGTQDIGLANDGIQDQPGRYFKPSKVPFLFQIDLQDAHVIHQVDLSTNLVPGSETFYQFTVDASTDGNEWDTIADATKNVDPGFVAVYPESSGKYRFIRLNVKSITNNINGHEANWASGISEVTVYGF